MWGMEEELQVVSRVARYALEIDTTDAARSAVVVKEFRKEFKDDGACLKSTAPLAVATTLKRSLR